MANNNNSQKIEPSTQSQQSKKYSEDFIRFIKAAKESDNLVTMVLRCHLLTEYYMDKLLVAALSRGDILVDDDRCRFMFSDKLFVVESLNILPREIIDSLRKLNTLRNNCGHEQDYKILEGDVDKIGSPFGLTYLKIKKEEPEKELLFQTLMLIIARLSGQVDKYIQSKS